MSNLVKVYRKNRKYYVEKEGKDVEDVVVEVGTDFYEESKETVLEKLELDVEFEDGEIGFEFALSLKESESVKDVVNNVKKYYMNSGTVYIDVLGVSKEDVDIGWDVEVFTEDKLTILTNELQGVKNVIEKYTDGEVSNDMLEERFKRRTRDSKGENIDLRSYMTVKGKFKEKDIEKMNYYLESFGLGKYKIDKKYNKLGLVKQRKALEKIKVALDMHNEQVQIIREESEQGHTDEVRRSWRNKIRDKRDKLLWAMTRTGKKYKYNVDRDVSRKLMGIAKSNGVLLSTEEVKDLEDADRLLKYALDVFSMKLDVGILIGDLANLKEDEKRYVIPINSSFEVVIPNKDGRKNVGKTWMIENDSKIREDVGANLEVELRYEV